ncbi:hypothetical protein MICRO80W_420003 [Micrococcus luteus]|nr:hypothetical protein MICRO80W_420003 [Micrococcus luteus]
MGVRHRRVQHHAAHQRAAAGRAPQPGGDRAGRVAARGHRGRGRRPAHARRDAAAGPGPRAPGAGRGPDGARGRGVLPHRAPGADGARHPRFGAAAGPAGPAAGLHRRHLPGRGAARLLPGAAPVHADELLHRGVPQRDLRRSGPALLGAGGRADGHRGGGARPGHARGAAPASVPHEGPAPRAAGLSGDDFRTPRRRRPSGPPRGRARDRRDRRGHLPGRLPGLAAACRGGGAHRVAPE